MHRSDGLREQDAREFARLLQQALDSREIRGLLRSSRHAVDAGRLRAGALRERAGIAAVANPEYQAFLRAAALPEVRADAQAQPPDDLQEPGRGGLLAVLAVLTPTLSAMAAVLLLLIGYALRLVGLHVHLARGLHNAGWMLAGLAAVSALPGLAAVLVTAARNRPSPQTAPPPGPEAAHAYELWRQALLERGILPHLRRRIEAAHRTCDGDSHFSDCATLEP
ncbi:serine/threonine-protein kinase [Streptomyces sp. SDr-06]|uniref:hypothetical protein n=1 Tax=Streptomyces sp. SDr-06 TaxID=2267702 RepID=UPI000DEA134C|nr:hypothetical protein [Streptomyces sp. SDr-06]RCH70234.1 hypothetical protein DT019_01680 [Streptomyces sp. SDr-06]